MPEWLATIELGQVAIVATLLGGFLAAGRKITPVLRTLARLIDDITGEPERPGVAARPGILERLALLEAAQLGIAAELRTIKTALHIDDEEPTT